MQLLDRRKERVAACRATASFAGRIAGVMRTVGVAIAMVVPAGCDGSADTDPPVAPPTAASPTTATTPTTSTTTAPSTTLPATAAPATTAAPTTAPPPDPVEAAKAAVAARYEEFSVAANACVAEGAACDLPTVFRPFADATANLYRVYEERWHFVIDHDLTVRDLDLVTQSVVDVQVDGDTALLVGCLRDAAVAVDQSGVVVNDIVAFRREETLWERQAEQWRLVGGATFALDQEGDELCHF